MNLSDPAIEFVDSWQLGTEQLERLYDEVLGPSFPADELVPRSRLLPRLAQKESGACCRVAVDPRGRALAAIIADTFPSSRVLLLSYLAVREELRDRGLGSELARDAVPRWIEGYRPAIALAEVEDPRYYLGTEHGDASARLRLYERLGGRILPVPYVQPALADDAERVRHLLLMVFFSTGEALVDKTHLASGLLIRFLTEYFSSTEGETPVDDEFTKLIAACRRPEGIPLMSPTEYLQSSR